MLAGLIGALVLSAPVHGQGSDNPSLERSTTRSDRVTQGAPGAAGDSAPPVESGAAPRDRTQADADADAARHEALVRVSARGARVRVGGDATIGEHERVRQVVTVFGRTDILGIVTGNVVAVGGDVYIGPNAVVRGNITAAGGVVRADREAFIGGRISEMHLSASDLRFWLPDDQEVTIAFQPDWPRIARIVFVSGIMKTLFWFVVCAVLLAIAPGAVGRARQQAGTAPIASFVVGLFAAVLFVPVMAFLAVVLSVSIIGVPLLALLPVIALAFALALAIGFTSIASGIGGRLVGRATPIAALLIGLMLIWGTGLAGRYVWTLEHGRLGWGVALLLVGTAIELIVCTVGLGASLIAWSANRRRTPATPAPAAPVVTDVTDIDPLPQQL